MDSLLTNRYFCIAILIALCVVIYLYSQSDYCSIEGMQNVDLTPIDQEFTSHPWTNNVNGSLYGKVNTKENIETDAKILAQLKKEGYSATNFLPRKDVLYMNYIKSEDLTDSLDNSDDSSDAETTTPVKKTSSKKKRSSRSNPQPIDTRPDLSQCQPCPPCDRSTRKKKRVNAPFSNRLQQKSSVDISQSRISGNKV
jgi:hypothetical protein